MLELPAFLASCFRRALVEDWRAIANAVDPTPKPAVSEQTCPRCSLRVVLSQGERLELASRPGPVPLRRPCAHVCVRVAA